jgi:phenylalanyl-tRNA synthetase beta chain
MKVSVNALRLINEHYGSAGDPAPNGVDDLVQKIGAQLGAIEEVIPFGKRFDGVIVARVVSCEKHPNADRLNVCKIDDAGAAESVTRDENGLVQVVCGAPNVREGLLVAWLPPGVAVPNTYDKDPFVLEARDIRGQTSNGMLASSQELSLSDNHEGILEIEDDIKPGTSFAEAYHLKDDVVLDIENKMFTHRPDLFGWLGLAREIEGISRRPYKSPDWYRIDPEFPGVEAEELPLEVRNEIPELVPRFVAIALRDVEIKPSPVWLQADLARYGARSINNIVDYTNFYMILTGQPIHAYDYDKVRAFSGGGTANLTVRKPQPGEKITLLSGKTIEPKEGAMLVAAGSHLACLGGAMGGADTEVDENTRNIIIEAATWDMYEMRRTAMVHGIFTDAVTRFTKGQSPLQNKAVVAKIVDQIRRFAGGKVASPLVDEHHLAGEVMERGSVHAPVTVTTQFVNERLGFKLSAGEMKTLLTNVEFTVEVQGDELTVTAPFWRTDIEIPEDVVEEVGRLYGYDHLPLELPIRDLTPPAKNRVLELKAQIRNALRMAGANELLTYSFVHGDLLDRVGQDREQAFRLSNALSPDLQYYRLSLTPSLLEKVHPNVKAGYNEFALFELGTTHNKTFVDDTGLPLEFDNLSLVYTAAKSAKPGAAYYEARKYLTNLAAEMGMRLEFKPLDNTALAAAAPFQPSRAALVYEQDGSEAFGVVGEFKPGVQKALKLPEKTAGFEVGIGPFLNQTPAKRYTSLPRFPKVSQDICLKVAANLPYQELHDFVWQELDKNRPQNSLLWLEPVDIYQRPEDKEHKQITFRVSIADYEKTMTDTEVNDMLERVAAAARERLEAERI